MTSERDRNDQIYRLVFSAGVDLVCVVVDRRKDFEYSPPSDYLTSACHLLNEKREERDAEKQSVSFMCQ